MAYDEPPNWDNLDRSKPLWWETPHYDIDGDCPCPDHAGSPAFNVLDKWIRRTGESGT